MSICASSIASTPTTQAATKPSTVIGPVPGTSSSPERTPGSGNNEFHLRNAGIVDQQAVNRHPVAIVGVGAIGSHLAEQLAKLGVTRFTLIDFDEVDTINLGVQGFYEREVGMPKVTAVANRLEAIHGGIEVQAFNRPHEPELIPDGASVFCCVDSIKTRRQIFRQYCEQPWSVLFDGRMAAESLQVYTVERSPDALGAYRNTLFPTHEAFRESCTARATIYCASMAAAVLCAQYKRWAMRQSPEPRLQFDLVGMDVYR